MAHFFNVLKEKVKKLFEAIRTSRKVQIGIAITLFIIAVVVSVVIVVRGHEKKAVFEPSTESTAKATTNATTATEPETTTDPYEKYVSISAESIQNDLRIKFYNHDGKLFTGVEFRVSLTPVSGGKTVIYAATEKDGKINIAKLPAGKYKLKLTEPSDYTCEKEEYEVTVKAKLEYKVIKHVKDDAKKESEINVAKEAPKAERPQEQVLKDTVEYVPSGSFTVKEYVRVLFSDIVKPEELVTDPSVEPSTEPSTEPSSEPSSVLSPEQLSAVSASSEVKQSDKREQKERLVDKSGNELFVKSGDEYIEAFSDDYDEEKEFFRYTDVVKYTGWQTIDGNTYYFDKNGKPVTGKQVINGAAYTFTSEGKLPKGAGVLGIDVSKYQGTIDWTGVKNSGIKFVIIRCGYRGWGSGALVRDPNFDSYIKGAEAVGLDVGIYFFSQAINEKEAIEEASFIVECAKGHNVKLPLFIDIETSGGNGDGRADKISYAQRTAVAKAFCQTVKNSGYRAGVYANKNYLTTKFDASQLSGYYIWLAHYVEKTNYNGKYDIWQYSSKGSVPGISGNVDMNLAYTIY